MLARGRSAQLGTLSCVRVLLLLLQQLIVGVGEGTLARGGGEALRARLAVAFRGSLPLRLGCSLGAPARLRPVLGEAQRAE